MTKKPIEVRTRYPYEENTSEVSFDCPGCNRKSIRTYDQVATGKFECGQWGCRYKGKIKERDGKL